MTITLVRYLCVFCMMLPVTSSAGALYAADGYATVLVKPTKAQRDSLETIVVVDFQRTIHTNQQAISQLLKIAGYTLLRSSELSKDTQAMLMQPLPLVDRHLGPLTVQQAVLTLAGRSVFTLEQDPIHRRVNLVLAPQLSAIYQKNKHDIGGAS